MSSEIKRRQSLEAWMHSHMFELGMGSVVVARHKPDGDVECGFFLIDAFCLGVKDADFFRTTLEHFENDFLPDVRERGDLETISPSCARKLVEEAAAYALRIGFSPHKDFKKACRVLGGVEAADCPVEFTFGYEGKPRYIPGPYDTFQKQLVVLTHLDRLCGRGNYHFDSFEAVLPPDEELASAMEEER